MVTEKTFLFHFAYKEEYLPTKRHKALRHHFCEADMDVKVEERDEADFPVAGIVSKNNFDDTHKEEAVFRTRTVGSGKIPAIS